MDENFFDKVFNIYKKIKVSDKNKNFYRLDKIAYYAADENNGKLSASKNIYEVDISSAFPTICNHIFSKSDPFIIKLNELTDKLSRNIFISTTLKDTGYLKQLNLISKMIISTCVMQANPDNDIFELKKDGIVYSGDRIINTDAYEYYTEELGFKIKENKYNSYVRYNKTSYYVTDDDVIIKGVYKDRPQYLMDMIKKYYLEGELNTNELNQIYSNKYYEIIRFNKLNELFDKYYLCENNKYLTKGYRYSPFKTIFKCEILPKNYLKMFLYPLLT